MRNLADEDLTQAVLASFHGSERFKTIADSLVRHLHAFAGEVGLTEDGVVRRDRLPHPHRPHHRRQAPGVRPAVRRARALDAGDRHQQPRGRAGATESTVFGPFFVEGSPAFENGDDLANGAPASRASCRAGALDRGRADPGALLDVWQADEDGFYDVQYAGPRRGARLAATCTPTTTGASGSGPSSPRRTRSHRRPGRASCSAATAAARCAPRTCTSRSPRTATDADDPRLRRGRPVPRHRRRLRRRSSLIGDLRAPRARRRRPTARRLDVPFWTMSYDLVLGATPLLRASLVPNE